MKNVSELEGAELDYWVAKIEGAPGRRDVVRELFGHGNGHYRDRPVVFYPGYSTDWSQGGPIIEREQITILKLSHDGHWVAGKETSFDGDGWSCWYAMDHESVYVGPTPLIAAMRAFVASKFGNSVD